MAAYDYSRPIADTRSFWGSIVSPFHALYAAVATWNDERVTRKALNALSDHELDDLGLCRGDIAEISGKNFRR